MCLRASRLKVGRSAPSAPAEGSVGARISVPVFATDQTMSRLRRLGGSFGMPCYKYAAPAALDDWHSSAPPGILGHPMFLEGWTAVVPPILVVLTTQ